MCIHPQRGIHNPSGWALHNNDYFDTFTHEVPTLELAAVKGLAACTLASGLFLLMAGDVNHFMPIGESKALPLPLEVTLEIGRGVMEESCDR